MMILIHFLPFALLSLLHISDVLTDTSFSGDGFYVGTEKVSRWVAARKCYKKSMQIVSIQNAEKNKQIEKLLKQHKFNKAIWTSGLKTSPGHFSWLREDVTYTSWAPNEPNSVSQGMTCLEISLKSDGLRWNDQRCEDQRGYICEKRPESNQTKEFILSREKATRKDALIRCDEMSMQLASIDDQDQNENLYQLLIKEKGKKFPFWTSGYRPPHAEIINIALVTFHQTWLWLNEKPMKYFNWASGEPNGNPGYTVCVEVVVRNDDLLWNDHSCSAKRRYICESIESE